MNAVVRQPDHLPATVEPTSMLHALTRAASDPNVDPDKLERIYALLAKAQDKQSEQDFNAAMSRAQSGMGRISADAVNPQTRSAYATYGKLDAKLRPIYTREGFALSFGTGTDAPEGHVRVVCHVSHAAGHTRMYLVDMPNDGKGAKGNDVMTKTHATGSAMTYGQRYLLKLIFNVAIGEQDDDGNGASDYPITDEQAATIREWLEAAAVSPAKFCQTYGIDAVPDLPEKKFADALQALKDKKKLRDQKAAGA
jgi:hypothetical protein